MPDMKEKDKLINLKNTKPSLGGQPRCIRTTSVQLTLILLRRLVDIHIKPS